MVSVGYGFGQNDVRWGFSSVRDWFDSVIVSFPAPWIIGDDTHYGTEIYDSRGNKVLSVWMAWGNPSERQRGDMTDAEWSEYCCDSHWESETQWHMANVIVTTRNYLQAHKENGWHGDDEEQRGILRDLIMTHGRWEEEVDSEIACGGPDRRMTSSEHEPLSSYGEGNRRKDKTKILKKLKGHTPTQPLNPEAKESHARRSALTRAIFKMIDEHPPQPLQLANGLKIDSFTMMDKPYLERMVQIADEEYEKLKRKTTDRGKGPDLFSPRSVLCRK